MSFPGFSTGPAIGIATSFISIRGQSPTRNIGGIIPDCTLEEEGTDELTITKHPIEIGADISDHVYKQPARLVMRVAWSNSSVEAIGDPNYVVSIYQQLLALQVSGQLFTITTGKRQYANMQMSSLSQTTDEKTEFTLAITAVFEQILIAVTSATTVPPAAAQADPPKTAQTQNLGNQSLVPTTVPSLGH